MKLKAFANVEKSECDANDKEQDRCKDEELHWSWFLQLTSMQGFDTMKQELQGNNEERK